LTSTTCVYLRPQSLDQALNALAQQPLTILAGGTDFYAARSGDAITDSVLDITALPELQSLQDEGAQWRIGATVTWTQIVRATLPPQLRALQQAARDVGGIQVQNVGTVAGNVCNASPSADGIPVLLALDAQVELCSLAGRRTVPLGEFVLGNRRIARLPGELVTGILVPRLERARSSFLKLGNRRYLVISIAMVAVLIDTDADGVICHAGIAVGSCSEVAQRLRTLEQKLLGRHAAKGLSALAEPQDLLVLSPIDDVRGRATYRRDAALTLVRRAIEEALHE
jgi:CO/xanthine dehydrogenase FAD-binding subunit